MAEDTPVWFVTGCSTGFGREIAAAVLARGWRVAATARDPVSLGELGGGDRLLPLRLDVTDQAQVDDAAAAALDRFGRIDVLVNNAGYGYQASVEEGEADEIRAQFEANVFGLFAVTRAILPGMRERGSGHVVNITSVAGLAGYPGSGYYAASKHAVEGWSDSLLSEVGPLGIRVTCVEPGPFRTDWAGRSLRQTPGRIAAYAETAHKRMIATREVSGTQAGDPVRVAEQVIAMTQGAEAPRHMVMGRWGQDAVTERLRERLAEVEAGRERAIAADFPEG